MHTTAACCACLTGRFLYLLPLLLYNNIVSVAVRKKKKGIKTILCPSNQARLSLSVPHKVKPLGCVFCKTSCCYAVAVLQLFSQNNNLIQNQLEEMFQTLLLGKLALFHCICNSECLFHIKSVGIQYAMFVLFSCVGTGEINSTCLIRLHISLESLVRISVILPLMLNPLQLLSIMHQKISLK